LNKQVQWAQDQVLDWINQELPWWQSGSPVLLGFSQTDITDQINTLTNWKKNIGTAIFPPINKMTAQAAFIQDLIAFALLEPLTGKRDSVSCVDRFQSRHQTMLNEA
jgi:hypothetical protein